MVFRLDPERVAHFEAHGWRAYYDRAWLRLLRLIVQLCQEQFRIPPSVSLLASYYVVRAAAAWAPLDHDERVVLAYYEKFYRLARRFSGLRFDPTRAAELELRYNDVHRRLVGQSDKAEFVDAMTELHAELFGVPPAAARASAELRVAANNTVDLITSGVSRDPEADWCTLERYLVECYRVIEIALAESERTHKITA